MCMSNHDRGRIRTAALHAWHIDKMHLKHALLDRWSTKGRDVSGEEKEIVGGNTIIAWAESCGHGYMPTDMSMTRKTRLRKQGLFG